MEVFNVSVIQIYKQIIVHWFIIRYLSADVSLLSIFLIQQSLHMWDG